MILKTHRHVAEAVFRLRNVLRDVLLRNTGMCEIRMRPTAGPRAIRLMSLQMYVRTVSGAAVGGRGEWEAVESSPENRPERERLESERGGEGAEDGGSRDRVVRMKGPGERATFCEATFVSIWSTVLSPHSNLGPLAAIHRESFSALQSALPRLLLAPTFFFFFWMHN